MQLKKIIYFLTQEEGEIKHKIVRAGFWMILTNTTIRILEFTRSIILARLLTPEIFGIWGIVNFIRQGIEVFTQTGFGAEIIYRQNRIKEAADVAWTLNILRGFTLAIICFLVAPYIAKFYQTPILKPILRIVSISFIIKAFYNINIIFFQKELDFKKIAVLRQFTVLIGLVVTLTLAFLWRNIWALVWGTLAYFTADLIFSYIIQKIRPKIHFEKDLFKEIFRYGIFIAGSGIIIFLTTELDNALVGKILGMKALGFYVLAYTLANIPATEITHVVSKIMFPAYSRVQNDVEKLKKLYLKTLRLVSIFAIPIAGGLFILAPEIIKVIYGRKWIPVIPILRILCFYGAIRAIQATTGPLFCGIGKPNYDFHTQIVRLITLLLSLYPFTVIAGLEGAAYSVSLSILGACIYAFYRLNAFIYFVDVFREIYPSLISSLIMVILLSLIKIFLTNLNSYFSLFSFIFLGIFIYASVYIYFFLFQDFTNIWNKCLGKF